MTWAQFAFAIAAVDAAVLVASVVGWRRQRHSRGDAGRSHRHWLRFLAVLLLAGEFPCLHLLGRDPQGWHPSLWSEMPLLFALGPVFLATTGFAGAIAVLSLPTARRTSAIDARLAFGLGLALPLLVLLVREQHWIERGSWFWSQYLPLAVLPIAVAVGANAVALVATQAWLARESRRSRLWAALSLGAATAVLGCYGVALVAR